MHDGRFACLLAAPYRISTTSRDSNKKRDRKVYDEIGPVSMACPMSEHPSHTSRLSAVYLLDDCQNTLISLERCVLTDESLSFNPRQPDNDKRFH